MKNLNSVLLNSGRKVSRGFACLVIAAFVNTAAIGCDGFTDVDLPASQLTADAVFEDRATATAAMVDIYARIRDNGLLTGNLTGLSAQLGLYADELTLYGGEISFYNNSLLPSAYEISELWNSSYNQVYAANAIVEGVDNSVRLSTSDKNTLKGEALFVRALLHFYLYNVFNDIPYVVTTNYEANRHVQKNSKIEIYQQLVRDLEQAITLLPENYITSERVRPNKATAQALLARVYLYNESWAEASNAASAVINQTGLYGQADIDMVFLKDAPSTIWQLSPDQPGGNTIEATTFSFIEGPPPATALSSELYNAFIAGDLRKTHWITTVTDGAESWHHASKYKQATNTGSSMEYSIVLRLAEQFLIRAEARAHQGDLIGANGDLDQVRQVAGLQAVALSTQATILQAIQEERRLEFFTEFGHRFFDLKRTGTLDATLSGVKQGWDSSDRNFPLPEAELLLNDKLLPQNPGY